MQEVDQDMNFTEAVKLMVEGKTVQSLVSYTTYEMVNGNLLAEGRPVPGLSAEEANGE